MTRSDWINIALCASARAEHAVEARDEYRAIREGITALLLYRIR